MKAMDVMIREVVTVGPDDDVGEAVKLLMAHDISALPVIDDLGTVVGIISEVDLMHRPEIGTEKHPSRWPRSDHARFDPGARLRQGPWPQGVRSHVRHRHLGRRGDAARRDRGIARETTASSSPPVLRGGKLVGIVSRSNLIQALAASHIAVDADAESDRAIRLKLLERLAGQAWTDFGSRNVIVSQGRRASVGAHQLRRRAQGADGAGRGDRRRQESDGRDHSRLLTPRAQASALRPAGRANWALDRSIPRAGARAAARRPSWYSRQPCWLSGPCLPHEKKMTNRMKAAPGSAPRGRAGTHDVSMAIGR